MKSVVHRGHDVPVKLTIKGADGLPMVIDSLTALIVIFYNAKTSSVLEKFSKETLAGHVPITIVNSSQGIIQCTIPRSKTAAADTGEYLLEFKSKVTSAGLEANLFATGAKDIVAFELKDSRLRDA